MEEKLSEVLNKNGWDAVTLRCDLCPNYSHQMFINVKCAGFDYEHKTNKDLLTEKTYCCLVNPVNDRQNLKELWGIISDNKEEIFGSDYDCTWTSEPCSLFQDKRRNNYKITIAFEKEI